MLSKDASCGPLPVDVGAAVEGEDVGWIVGKEVGLGVGLREGAELVGLFAGFFDGCNVTG